MIDLNYWKMKSRILFIVFGLFVGHLGISQTLYVPSGTGGIGSSSNGNVGIGTVSPDYLLKLYSTTWDTYKGIAITSAGAHLFLRPKSAIVGDWELLQAGNYGNMYIGRDSKITKFRGYLELIETDDAVKIRLSKNGISYFNGGSVGIGTTTPDALFDIEGSNELLRLTYGNTAGYIRGYKSGYNHWYVGAGSSGGDDIHFTNYKNAKLHLLTNGQYRLSIGGNGNVGIGVTDPTHKLTVDGTISAKEVKVSTTPNSDYVFEPDYALLPIQEVETFVKQNKHLPDIPSSEEFKENGVGLGEMDDMLLRKVEELTLYVIELKKENEILIKQASRVDQIEKKLNELIQTKK